MRAILLAFLFFLPLAAQAQDIEAGQSAFRKCLPCHAIGEGAANKIGPALNGMFGRKAAAVRGFAYSAALSNSGIVWDDNSFAHFLEDPRGSLPGNKMTFTGIKDQDQIANIAAYLKQFDETGKIGAMVPAKAESPPPATPAPGCVQSFGTRTSRQSCAKEGGEVLQAMAVVVGAMPALGGGTFEGNALVSRGDSGSPSFVRRFALAPGNPCLAEATIVSQWTGQWAELARQVYDFRKIRRVRYLSGTVEVKGGAAAAARDPAVSQIAIEGPDWICRENLSLDAAQSTAQRACEAGATVDAAAPERKSVMFAALDIIRKACRLPK